MDKTELTLQVLKHLNEHETLNSLGYARKQGLSHDALVGALKSLSSLSFVELKQLKQQSWVLTEEAKGISRTNSPEVVLLKALEESSATKADLEKRLGSGVVRTGFLHAMRKRWIALDKKSGVVSKIEEKPAATIADSIKESLLRLEDGAPLEEKEINDLKKRKLINNSTRVYYEVTKGPKFALELPKLATDLTSEMLASGEWEKMEMKKYNLNALGAPPPCGNLHPLLKVRAEYRQIFLEMGFQEMKTNQFVENSFWNFDTLFQPQQHPARDAHDTFFVSHPAKSEKLIPDYLKKVKEMHERGGEGSIGWKYDWSLEESQKNILRTHTTAVSSRTLYALAQNGFKPGKYFSIDRVYRNEAMDATHLAEFHQVEGFVVDRGLTLGNLIGVIQQFFNYLGITQLQFKPAYNPYTEPSMEIFSYHQGLGKWVEIGNSGIFRPEMLRPMGLPEDVVCIAWGLSLERPTMIKYKIDNIRELVGHKLDLEFVETHPIVRLDK